MVTSVASFSSQRAAMRRACSSDVRSVSFLGRDGPSAGPGIGGVECTGGSRTSRGRWIWWTSSRERGDHSFENGEIDAWARGGADSRELQHPLGPRPGREGGELVGSEQEHGIRQLKLFERVDRTRKRIEGHLGYGER